MLHPPQGNVFSVFCIGTGHSRAEPNNVMKWLYDNCYWPGYPKDLKYINDGVMGGGGPLHTNEWIGVGMADMKTSTMNAIKRAVRRRELCVTRINLAGHSRGAVLCHMLAEAIRTDPETQHLEVSMALLDPVHMSNFHPGAKALEGSNKFIQCLTIIMENVNSFMFPFKFIEATDDETQAKIYYVKMPGTHGSGTQVLTNPIGKCARN
jgi:hypothetical protein